jgi:ribosome-binding protein aMBF1 (putative translation factor)
MSSVETLISAAESKFGSRRKLAEAIREDQAFLGKIARGAKPLSPTIAAKLAHVAGLDPRMEALTALVSQEKDPDTRAELARLLGVTATYSDMRGNEGLLHLIV